MKCCEIALTKCHHCGTELEGPCRNRAAFVVFFGEPGLDPDGFCVDHKDAMGSGWISGRIEYQHTKKSRTHGWMVKVEGKWYAEDSEEYYELRAKQLGVLETA